jgi:hypothetical protein
MGQTTSLHRDLLAPFGHIVRFTILKSFNRILGEWKRGALDLFGSWKIFMVLYTMNE